MQNLACGSLLMRTRRMFVMSRGPASFVSRIVPIVILAAFAPSLAAQTWTATGSMTTARFDQTVTLLDSGQVLVAGGYGSPTATAELYDPTSGTFTATGSMTTPRADHTATLLSNGQVLIAGGASGCGALSSAELYDPATGTFTATGSMATPRADHTATLLSNGQVLIAGGQNSCGAVLASAELYDPTTGTFTPTGTMTTAHDLGTATVLNNGMVLIAGGTNPSQSYYNGATAGTDLYNPATGTFAATGSLNTERYYHTATLLGNGMVLITGGYNPSGCVASAELYSPAAGTFTLTGTMTTPRYSHTATLLTNGQVLLAGGSNGATTNAGSSIALASAELYDPSAETFTATGSMTQARQRHKATLLNAGTVLVAGGYPTDGTVLASAELYQPVQATLSMGPQAMEGNLELAPGSTLEAGYDFTMPGNHPAATVTFTGAQVTFAWTCVSGSGSGTLVVPMANQSYTDAQNSSAWYPSGDQNSSLVYQGSIAVPNYCSGGLLSFQAGGTFSTSISSTDTTDKVNVRWHYSGGGSAGSWSGTQSIVP
jgi:Galactose oxidase, central domain